MQLKRLIERLELVHHGDEWRNANSAGDQNVFAAGVIDGKKIDRLTDDQFGSLGDPLVHKDRTATRVDRSEHADLVGGRTSDTHQRIWISDPPVIRKHRNDN